MTISRGTTRIIFSDREVMRVPAKSKPARDDKHSGTTFGVVYVNDLGRDSMLKGKPAEFPTGSTIVRERRLEPDGLPDLLVVMIKRAPGFNSKGGDWEFLTLDGNGGKVKHREKTGGCLQCHSRQKNHDFVFRPLVASP